MASVHPEGPLALRIAIQLLEQGLALSNPCNLRLDVPGFDTVENLRWKGPRLNCQDYCQRMKAPDLLLRVRRQTQ
jgi:hypothetical protein